MDSEDLRPEIVQSTLVMLRVHCQTTRLVLSHEWPTVSHHDREWVPHVVRFCSVATAEHHGTHAGYDVEYRPLRTET